MKQFEEGKIYGAWDTGTPAIKIIKRTAKMCLVEDTITGNQWRMKIKEKNGYEELTDTGVPQSWRRCIHTLQCSSRKMTIQKMIMIHGKLT